MKIVFRVHHAREFARLAGVTIRALHHYDRLGLLTPRRSASGYRVYRTEDLARLEQIVALRFIGMSLRDIRKTLESGDSEILASLEAQRRLLEENRSLLDRAIQAIAAAQTQKEDRTAALRKIIEVIGMENNQDWTSKYATEAGLQKIEARRTLWSPELQERVSRQWSELAADVEAALGEDPASEKARALAARWNSLVEEFTGRDRDIEESVANVWANRESWPKDAPANSVKITPAMFAFIGQVNALTGSSLR